MFTAGGMTGLALTGHSICLQVNLLRDSQGIIDLGAQILNRALKLCVTKQDLNGSEVAGFPIDQRCLCTTRK